MSQDVSESSVTQSGFEGAGKPGWRGRLLRIGFLVNRFWWLLLLFIVMGIGTQVVRLSLAPPKYRSVGRMILNGHISVPSQGGDVYSEDLMLFYGTQVTLMKSGEIYSEAVKRVRAVSPETPIDEFAAVDAIQLPKTSVFELQTISVNPDYARQLLDAVMEVYEASKRNRKDNANELALSAETEQLNKLDADIKSDSQQMQDFQKENNVVYIEERSASAASYLVSLSNELARLKKEYDLLNLEQAAKANNGGTGSTSNAGGTDFAGDGPLMQADANIAAEQENIAKLKILRDQYGQYLKDKHPKMKAFTEAIDKEEKFLEILKTRDSTLEQSRLSDLAIQIQNTQKQLDEWNKTSLDLNQRLEIFEQLKAKINRESASYSDFSKNIQSLDTHHQMEQDDVVTLSQASAPILIDPNYPVQIAIGAAAGLVIAGVLIFLIDKLDNRINSPMDLEENFQAPILGQIPIARIDRQSSRVPLLSEKDPRHLLGESYRNIRSSILFRPNDGPRPRSILITSSIPGEGKSTVASNLAASLAFSGVRVLLVDADLRRGVLHRIIPTETELGLAEYLQGQVGWREVVQDTAITNLKLIQRGKVARNAGDLLLSYAMDVLLSETANEYDMVLWDSAPILATDDVANICSSVDAVILVVRTGFSTFDSVIQALDEIGQRRGKILGIVANAVRSTQPGYKNKYRYNEYNVVSKT